MTKIQIVMLDDQQQQQMIDLIDAHTDVPLPSLLDRIAELGGCSNITDTDTLQILQQQHAVVPVPATWVPVAVKEVE